MNKIKHVLTILLCLPLFSVWAQTPISLADCKQKALEHNQNIKSAEAQLEASEASLTSSKRAILPQIDLSASYHYMNDPRQMVIPGFELPTVTGTPSGVYSPGKTTNLNYNNSYTATVGLALPIYVGGKIAQGKKIADQAKEISQANVALSKTQVLLNIEKQYWGLVALHEQAKVTAKP